MAFHLRLAAAALLCAAGVALTACGSESGNARPADDSGSPTTSSTDSPTSSVTVETSAAPSTPAVASDPATMKCREFTTLTEDQQIAVLRANGATADDEQLRRVARLLNIASCAVWPDMLVADVMAGKTGP